MNKSELTKLMRKLWSDHVFWTRMFIISGVHELPDLTATESRLLKNQKDLAEAFSYFFGEEAKQKVNKLLDEHILIAKDILLAAKSNQPIDQLKVKWINNASEISKALSTLLKINFLPFYQMMLDHLNLTTAELMGRLQGNYEDDINKFEQVLAQALHMGDNITEALLKQFGAKS